MTTIEAVRQPSIFVGVDTHKDQHHAAVLDPKGTKLGNLEFAATTAGYRNLTSWLATLGEIELVGIEGSGSFGSGLTRFLRERDVDVREINQPHRHLRARVGKTDPIDAEAAARKVLSGAFTVKPKDTTGIVESIRLLSAARNSAVRAKSSAVIQLKCLLVTVPAPLREAIDGKWGVVKRCQALRPDMARLDDPLQSAKYTLRTVARRIRDLEDEIAVHDVQLKALVEQVVPTLLSRVGIGPVHAAQLLVTAGQNLDRLRSDAQFARLCGVAPIPASSGKSSRMRLHKGGHRQANRSLHLIAVVRLRYDPRSKAYMERRMQEGLSKKDVLRCLKRFIAREVFYDLKHDLLTGPTTGGPATHLA
jgi:transposase